MFSSFKVRGFIFGSILGSLILLAYPFITIEPYDFTSASAWQDKVDRVNQEIDRVSRMNPEDGVEDLEKKADVAVDFFDNEMKRLESLVRTSLDTSYKTENDYQNQITALGNVLDIKVARQLMLPLKPLATGKNPKGKIDTLKVAFNPEVNQFLIWVKYRVDSQPMRSIVLRGIYHDGEYANVSYEISGLDGE